MGEPERDAIDIYFLLYPMLTDGQRDTSEGRKAHQLAQKYRAFSKDSDKLVAYDHIVHIIEQQLLAERPLLRRKHAEQEMLTQRLEAYRNIVRMLTIADEFKDSSLGWLDYPMQKLPPEPDHPKAPALAGKTSSSKAAKAPAKKQASKSTAKNSAPRPGSRKKTTAPLSAKKTQA